MYREYFGLREAPFGVTPDARFFFNGRTHDEALSSLWYGIEQRQGFVMVTGEVGTGKTLLCRALLQRLGPRAHTALILNPHHGPRELLRVIAADFGCDAAGDDKVALLAALARFLLDEIRRGKIAVIVIDEAQTLPDDSLEEIRLLSNLETDREKLLQIVLVGQPELSDKLQQPHLRQVNQRITVRFRLQPLGPQEIRRYIAHRLRVASARGRSDLFSPGGLRAVSHLSRGYPREINALCDRALLAAYAAGRRRVGIRLVYRAYRDLKTGSARRPRATSTVLRWALLAVLALAAGWYALPYLRGGGRLAQPAKESAPTARQNVLVPAQPAPVAVQASEPPPSAPQAEAGAEVPSDGKSLSASLATLAGLWKRDALAAEVLRWQFVSLQDQRLPAFFQKSGLSQTYGVEFLALPATLSNLRAVDLPCLASEKSERGGYRFVVLAGLRQNTAVVMDPVAGRRLLPVETWLPTVRGSLYFLVPRGDFTKSLRLGDRGPAVIALQKQLRRAGLLRTAHDGVFRKATRDAVRAFQRKQGLEEDGVAGFETRLRLLRLGGQTLPSLQEQP